MDVIDFLKKKREILAAKNFDVSEILSPTFRDYWADISQTLNEHWHHWFGQDQINGGNGQVQAFVPAEPALAVMNRVNSRLNEEHFVGEWHEVTQEQISGFGDVTHDQQWIHVDPERARRESPFRQTIAHGFLTLSMLPYLTNTVDPEQPEFPEAKMCVNYGLNQVRFHYPVKPGNRIRVRSRHIAVTEIKRGLEIVTEHTVEIENFRRPACVAEAVMRIYF